MKNRKFLWEIAQYGKPGACEPYFDFKNAIHDKLGCFFEAARVNDFQRSF